MSIHNVRVANVSFDYPSASSAASNVFVGEIVWKVEEIGTGSLTMTSCRYEQLVSRNSYVYPNAITIVGAV